MGDFAGAFASFDRAMPHLNANEVSPLATCGFYRVVLNDCYEGFDLERAQLWTTAFERWCNEQPDLLTYSGLCHSYRARLLLIHGRWAEASAAAHLAEEQLRAGDFTARYLANYELGELNRLRGELRAAEEHYLRAGETVWDPEPGLALLRLAKGENEVAQHSIRRAIGAASPGGRGRMLPAVVEIELAVGDIAAARRAADELIALNERAPTPMREGAAHFARAQVELADDDPLAARESMIRATSAWSALDAPYEMARCRVMTARILEQLGDPDSAAIEREAAREVFQRLGARIALADLVTTPSGRGPGILTAREIEVLRLVSTGLTNRGIAGELSLSEKTVARHLSNIYEKLDLSSRSAATAYAFQNGLI
jgi:ATP/maltotriose-dependent transcriptional regulator MalT